ncbi:GtrA family protein [Streptomyces pactum]|uniref:GtrA family protein n=1 Tax=Streptomyces pactum TaxID=68249 RepID=A0ABS0NN54_9ACTN|nr:GtrA family protein [Streptomyces pactum]MBH5336635.1 GtrA family protein [Streptomyces pactum]
MSERRTLRAQVEQLVREVAKFGAVGGMGVLVNLGVFNLLRHTTELPMVRAGIVATAVAIVFNYLGFRYFTYRDRAKSGRTREMSLFLLFSGVGLVIENGLLFTTTYGFGWDSQLQSNVFKFVGIGIATLFRFWSYRSWVFRALPVPEEGPAGGGTAGREPAAPLLATGPRPAHRPAAAGAADEQ